MLLSSSAATGFLIATLIILGGCVNLENMTVEERSAYLDAKEQRKYEREEGLITARDAFHMREANCKKVNGVMIIVRRFKNFSKSDYVHAYCTNPGDLLK